MFYGALVTTIIAVYKASQTWGTTFALALAGLNGALLFVFRSPLIALIIAGVSLLLMRGSGAPPSDPPEQA